MARRKAAAPVQDDDAIEELDAEDTDDLDDLDDADDDDELDDDEPEEEPAPKAKRGKKAAPAKAAKKTAAPKPAAAEGSGYDTQWLAGHVNEKLGTTYDARSMRMVLRKLAGQPDSPLVREVGTDRIRYDFPKGDRDPVTRAVLGMVKAGAVKEAREEGLANAKASKAKKTAAAPAKKAAAPAKATRRRRAAAE